MTILIARHGETDGNAARILQRPDVPLNERGMRQAEHTEPACNGQSSRKAPKPCGVGA
jgi:broad specificity phosphatase PhoE